MCFVFQFDKLLMSRSTMFAHSLASKSWLCRGFFQLFTALLTLELSRSTASGESDVHKSLKLYRIVAGCALVSCGGLYILCGILCWGRQKAKGRPGLEPAQSSGSTSSSLIQCRDSCNNDYKVVHLLASPSPLCIKCSCCY